MLVRFRNPSPPSGSWPVETEVLVTVDSGADVTLLPPAFAERLSVNLGDLTEGNVGSIGAPVRAYEAVRLRAELCGEWIGLPVRFYVEEGKAVLGRAGAFEAFQLAFVERDKIIYASRVKRPGR